MKRVKPDLFFFVFIFIWPPILLIFFLRTYYHFQNPLQLPFHSPNWNLSLLRLHVQHSLPPLLPSSLPSVYLPTRTSWGDALITSSFVLFPAGGSLVSSLLLTHRTFIYQCLAQSHFPQCYTTPLWGGLVSYVTQYHRKRHPAHSEMIGIRKDVQPCQPYQSWPWRPIGSSSTNQLVTAWNTNVQWFETSVSSEAYRPALPQNAS